MKIANVYVKIDAGQTQEYDINTIILYSGVLYKLPRVFGIVLLDG